MNFVVVIVLLLLPAIALQRQAVNFQWVGAYALLLNVLTYWVYAVDKRRAEEGEWRVPENMLHLLEIAGGWPGAFLAQRRLRHKCSKGSYQFIFWLIIGVYQFVAFDSLLNWQLSHEIGNWIEQTSQRRR